jgi:hypothetical protein
MPGSTGPDNNTYTIPEVQLGDTFNFWRDATNTAIYKLNKLKIYDAVGSGSIGVTYGSTGAWSASLAPTITEGLTFTQRIVFSNGITAAGVYSSRGITAIAGIWTTGGLSADRLYVGGGSTFASIVAFANGLSASTIYASSGSTFASSVSVGGGLSAANIYGSGGSTFAGVFYVGGGATFASTTNHTGAARFAGGVTASTLQVTGNTTVGSTSTSATLGVCGSVLLFGQTPLRFADADSSHWVAFRAPTGVTSNTTWTLPSGDGSAGQVLFTDGGGSLSWKAADGATGLDRYVQYNQGLALGACGGFVFEYTDASGICSGSIGLSGGLYCNKTVAIGLTQGAVTPRLYPASTAKLEVRGDIRIPSNGFFVNKGMTLPSAGITVAADENAFIAGTLVVPSGATLTVQTGGYIVIL